MKKGTFRPPFSFYSIPRFNLILLHQNLNLEFEDVSLLWFTPADNSVNKFLSKEEKLELL